MSDYIYGSSLKAAKSKANYLFEGDFRRRPSQNLSGASRSMARVELLQQAAEQRQNREDNRRREQSSLKIQALYRGYSCRKMLSLRMQNSFDKMIDKIKSLDNTKRYELFEESFDDVVRVFIMFYHSGKDQGRFEILNDLMQTYVDVVLQSKAREPMLWSHRIVNLLKMNLKVLGQDSSRLVMKNLSFLERFTRKDEVLNTLEADRVWRALVHHNFYAIIRKLIDKDSDDLGDEKYGKIIVELLRRSLELATCQTNLYDSQLPALCLFYKEFLKGPLCKSVQAHYLPELLELQPTCLKPSHILAEFDKAQSSPLNQQTLVNPVNCLNSMDSQEHIEAVWFCYAFLISISNRIHELTDSEKSTYIAILAKLIEPAEYMTNISLMQAANNKDDQDEDDVEEQNSSNISFQGPKSQKEAHYVIKKLVDLINHPDHINSLKSILFNTDYQSRIQTPIVRICNLMLAREHLAVFNCRLLYTIAFSKEFSRSLWKSIITSTSRSLYGTSNPIYQQIIRNNNISPESWRSFLPKLRLFCSLCSYLIPTLDDCEFYTDEEVSIFNNDLKQSGSLGKSETGATFFVDKDLIGISAILKDICVGFVEILYQSNRYDHQQTGMVFEQHTIDEQTRLISFETKVCFKALVRLIRQLHSKDSRKQFCPDGHWICQSVVIPANKAIDFQMTTQQGRLINQITREDAINDRSTNTPSEIKTVLILQEIPFIISFHDRVQIFHQLLSKERQIHQSDNYHFGLPGSAIHVQIRRNYIYEDAFEKLSTQNEPNLKLPLKVSLINAVGADEAGIDGGGLTKEFLGELLKAGFDPMRGFFKSTKDNLLYPNPSANVLFSTLDEGYEVHYEFLGRMLGKAIFQKIMVELPLASFFLAKLLAPKHSSDVDLHNLESLDPVLYKNLVYLKNYKGNVSDLNLDFTISNNELGEHEIVELKPNGSKILVERENRIEFVHLVADYRLNKQIKAQCAAFKRGLSQLIDLDWLRMFDPRELQILISGAPTMIDIYDWRRHTVYANGYSDDCEAINIFWRVVSQFDESQKRKLLKFATSCSLPPLLGFKELVPQFAVAPSEESRLPTASTCMNLLKLPECEDESTMRSKLLYAIESNSGFELS